ncbi:MAG TPA: hydantoinase/oxoprolinase family protein, partial [Dehalococcoidia bacterium]|nr:hydantoinase/oxoprolinase family protein [Dehalococcoidia bacterium]
MPEPRYWIGVDVGGTFTDLVLYDEAGRTLATAKTPTTPDDPSRGILAGLETLGVDLRQVTRFVHGTTIATNTVLEEKGATVSLLTTRGHRDAIEVGRGDRPILYNIRAPKFVPLVPRRRRHETDERTLYDGTVLRPVDPASVDEFAERARADGSTAVAVGFLHSYANPANERAAADRLADLLPGVPISLSSEVLPEFREYERFSTTVLNAYVAPVVDRYLERLEAGLRERGCRAELGVMTSSGGIVTADRARRLPVNLLLSGPAGGVAAAQFRAGQAGQGDVITYDMGGTSTDVCLIQAGQPAMTAEAKIGGRPNRTLQIEIHSIGSGGGSIAWIDAGRILNVGPQSAGAEPGPACYGRGGTEPTVTDANLLLGRIEAGRRLGGAIALQAEPARAAVGRLADVFGLGLEEAAEGILRIAVAQMVSAIKAVSIQRGHDPRDFALLAYGGAGPMHANLIAAELEMPRVIIPLAPGNFSALGVLAADLRHNYVETLLSPTRETSPETVRTALARLTDRGRQQLTADGVRPEDARFELSVGLRYRGQLFEIDAPVAPGLTDLGPVERAFYALHESRYGHSVDAETEIVNVRLSAFGSLPKPEAGVGSEARGPGSDIRGGSSGGRG